MPVTRLQVHKLQHCVILGCYNAESQTYVGFYLCSVLMSKQSADFRNGHMRIAIIYKDDMYIVASSDVKTPGQNGCKILPVHFVEMHMFY